MEGPAGRALLVAAALFAVVSGGMAIGSLVPGTGSGLERLFPIPFVAAFATFGAGLFLNRAHFDEIFRPTRWPRRTPRGWDPRRTGPTWLRALITVATVGGFACMVLAVVAGPFGGASLDGGVFNWGGTIITPAIDDARMRSFFRFLVMVALGFHLHAIALVVAGPGRAPRTSPSTSDLDPEVMPRRDAAPQGLPRRRSRRLPLGALVAGFVCVFSALGLAIGISIVIDGQPLRETAAQLARAGNQTSLDSIQVRTSAVDQEFSGVVATFTVDGRAVHAELAGAGEDGLDATTVVYDPADPTTAMLADDVDYFVHDDLAGGLGFIGMCLLALVAVPITWAVIRIRDRSGQEPAP